MLLYVVLELKKKASNKIRIRYREPFFANVPLGYHIETEEIFLILL